MRGTGDKPEHQIQAMTKGKSPWGSGKRGGNPAPEAADSPPPEDGEVKEAEAPADAPAQASGDAPARNPWLPPAEDEDGRRSPRMDDILRQRRGSSGGEGGGWPPLPGGDRARIFLPWVLAVSALLLALSTSIHVLEQGQSGTVTTLGRYGRSLGPGGMHLTMPWPLEVVTLRGGKDAEVLSIPDKGGEMLLLTRDGELIDLAFQLRWQVSDPRRFAGAFSDPEASLRALALAEMRAGVAEQPFDEIHEGKRQSELQQRVAGRIQRALDAMRAGVKLDSVEVIYARPPARLAEAFKKVGAAKAEVDRVRKQAQSYASQTRQKAQIEASEFNKAYEQYKLAPEVMRKRMYYEMMERVLRNNQNIVVGGDAAAAPAKAGAK